MLIGFHLGMWLTVYVIMSVVSRSEGPGGKTCVPARQVLLDDVVLGRALELGDVGALLLGDDLVERQQPHGGGVDRHRGVHLLQGDVLEQPAHVTEVRDRHADPADLAAGEDVVGVVAGLRRQVEGHRQAGLALGEVAPVQLVGRLGGGVTGVRAHEPRPVLLTLDVTADARRTASDVPEAVDGVDVLRAQSPRRARPGPPRGPGASTPTLPWWRLRCTSYAAWPVSSRE